MIFLSVGSREYPFDRLIKKIDLLVKQNIISDVFGQIGTSNYIPKYFEYQRFLSSETFQLYQDESELIISHGGTGTLIGALKKKKQLIVVPRLQKHGEHSDNHQLQIATSLSEAGYLKSVTDIEDLQKVIVELKNNPIEKEFKIPSNVLNVIENYLGTI